MTAPTSFRLKSPVTYAPVHYNSFAVGQVFALALLNERLTKLNSPEMFSNTVLDQTPTLKKEEKKQGEKETKWWSAGIVMKIEVVGEQATKRESQTERRGVADGDMLIYELQGFALTILSFTETERKVERKIVARNRSKKRETDIKIQKWGILTGRCRDGEEQGRKLKFRGKILRNL